MKKVSRRRPDLNKRPIKILLIEDDEFMRELYETLLKEHGHTVFALPDSLKLYEVLEKEDIDIIISGIMQPYKDGLEVLKELKENTKYRDIPYIICSVIVGNPGIRKKAFELGADLCLCKADITLDQFVEEIDKFIKGGVKKEPEIKPERIDRKSKIISSFKEDWGRKPSAEELESLLVYQVGKEAAQEARKKGFWEGFLICFFYVGLIPAALFRILIGIGLSIDSSSNWVAILYLLAGFSLFAFLLKKKIIG